MRYISDLSDEIIKKLNEIQKNGLKSRERNRAHAILLSNSGIEAKEIAHIFKVSRRTIYRWFDRTKLQDFSNKLNDLSGRGRIATLNASHLDIVLSLIKENNIKESCSILLSKHEIKVTPGILKRFLKKMV